LELVETNKLINVFIYFLRDGRQTTRKTARNDRHRCITGDASLLSNLQKNIGANKVRYIIHNT
jgi:hypothetical protein